MTDRSAIARDAAWARWASADPVTETQAMRDLYRDSFNRGHRCALCPEILIDQSLSPDEIARRAAVLRKRHFGRLGRASAQKRRKVPAP